jgi:hypothetical protein
MKINYKLTESGGVQSLLLLNMDIKKFKLKIMLVRNYFISIKIKLIFI